MPGEHNVTDAIAASAVALYNGISPRAVEEALGTFTGASRRLEFRGFTPQGAAVFDDYAHHPTEILSTIRAAAGTEPKRLFAVFQSHTYTRTKELFGYFAKVLADPEIHEAAIAEIYSARETETLGMSADLIADAVNQQGGHAKAYATFDEIAKELRERCVKGDMILVMGAGDITNLCGMLVKSDDAR